MFIPTDFGCFVASYDGDPVIFLYISPSGLLNVALKFEFVLPVRRIFPFFLSMISKTSGFIHYVLAERAHSDLSQKTSVIK